MKKLFLVFAILAIFLFGWSGACSEPTPTPILSPTVSPSPTSTVVVITSPPPTPAAAVDGPDIPYYPPGPAAAVDGPDIPYYLTQPSTDDSPLLPDDSLLVAVQRLGLLGDPQYIEAEGMGIWFVCKHRQHFNEDNTMDFQNCIMHIDDAQRFYDVFDVKIYMPVIGK